MHGEPRLLAALQILRLPITAQRDGRELMPIGPQPADQFEAGAVGQAHVADEYIETLPRGQFQGVLDSERFVLLRTLEFFASFGDVELWEVVHRAKWQRFHFGHALYRKGEEGNSFHIIQSTGCATATAHTEP